MHATHGLPSMLNASVKLQTRLRANGPLLYVCLGGMITIANRLECRPSKLCLLLSLKEPEVHALPPPSSGAKPQSRRMMAVTTCIARYVLRMHCPLKHGYELRHHFVFCIYLILILRDTIDTSRFLAEYPMCWLTDWVTVSLSSYTVILCTCTSC